MKPVIGRDWQGQLNAIRRYTRGFVEPAHYDPEHHLLTPAVVIILVAVMALVTAGII